MKTITRTTVTGIALCLAALGVANPAMAQVQCPGRPTLKIDFHTLNFSEHKPICVRPNGVFRIKLKAKGTYTLDYSKIDVEGKTGPGTFTKLSINPDNDVMRVRVSGYPVDTEAEFMIIVDGVGELDPRVRINNSFLALTIDQELMDDYALDNFGLSLLDLKEIDGYFQQEFDTTITEVTRSLGATTGAE
jgi:hypothetical protein